MIPLVILSRKKQNSNICKKPVLMTKLLVLIFVICQKRHFDGTSVNLLATIYFSMGVRTFLDASERSWIFVCEDFAEHCYFVSELFCVRGMNRTYCFGKYEKTRIWYWWKAIYQLIVRGKRTRSSLEHGMINQILWAYTGKLICPKWRIFGSRGEIDTMLKGQCSEYDNRRCTAHKWVSRNGIHFNFVIDT